MTAFPLETFVRLTLHNITFAEALFHIDGLSLMTARLYTEYERQQRAQLLAQLGALLHARAAVVEKWTDAYWAGELGP